MNRKDDMYFRVASRVLDIPVTEVSRDQRYLVRFCAFGAPNEEAVEQNVRIFLSLGSSLSEDEEDSGRASGQCICRQCGREYREHPYALEPKWIGVEGRPYLHRLCNGKVVKL